MAALEGRTVGISALGNADHALLLYLLDQAGVDADTVQFAAIGTNVFDALRIGQVDAAMLQEPALSLIVEAGGRELVNFMELEEARQHLGGPYAFMGVSVRTAERDGRLPEIRRLAAGLAAGLADTRTLPPAEIVAALPGALVAGGDIDRLERVIERYRQSLYPERVEVDVEAAGRCAPRRSPACSVPDRSIWGTCWTPAPWPARSLRRRTPRSESCGEDSWAVGAGAEHGALARGLAALAPCAGNHAAGQRAGGRLRR